VLENFLDFLGDWVKISAFRTLVGEHVSSKPRG
jgi:hypothetical protein